MVRWLPLTLSGWFLSLVLAAADDGLDPYWTRPIPAQGPAPAWATDNPVLTDLSAETCRLCHPAQFADWSASLHARAMSPGLLGQLDAFALDTQRDCLACHAPREESLDHWEAQGLTGAGKITAIDCAACHVRAHYRQGPRAIAQTPHGPVAALPLIRQAEFCAPCHQFDATGLAVNGQPLENTFAEWQASRYARAGVTCQTCHMPERSHAFKGIHDPETTRRALSVRALRVRDGLRVRAGNVGAGHALPTYVTPRILVRLQGADGTPSLEHAIARRMRWTAETGWEQLADDRLLPDQWVDLTLPLPPQSLGLVRVEVEPGHDYHQRIYPALPALLGERLSVAGLALLERARELAGRSAYTLYRFDCPAWGGAEEPCHAPP
ncbi:MAG TPA: multiheme c-type cytochrome [Lamprocystis sp. (in: g-proteobacteria)]|nr:multiheme c-type cytochrome [Lamprocystis sp. (in: g-proteobacteria)]